jgi:deoxyribodipyrimidine photolyase-related protein
MYLLRMPELRAANGLGADRPLPAAFWEPGAAGMRCLDAAVGDVHDRGYAHHIQRLMVLGNLGLLLGVRPLELSRWFRAAFVDASEWVELPNVHGMALFADDAFTTKPYAASGAYLDRMGDHCGRCRFDVGQRTGPTACPFNSLFWDFMARHRDRLGANPRLAVLLRTWDRFPPEEQARVRQTAELARARLAPPATAWSFDDDAA